VAAGNNGVSAEEVIVLGGRMATAKFCGDLARYLQDQYPGTRVSASARSSGLPARWPRSGRMACPASDRTSPRRPLPDPVAGAWHVKSHAGLRYQPGGKRFRKEPPRSGALPSAPARPFRRGCWLSRPARAGCPAAALRVR
jgi:hypothetical protein